MNIAEKYASENPFIYCERTWPDNKILSAPQWCSVDLRDGNQALVSPMNVRNKLAFFRMLTDIGIREIEVGFPSASNIEYEFLRKLAEKNLIPENVFVQVLAPCRSNLIARTMQAIRGIRNPIIHIYSSTAPLMRNVVFKMDKENVKRIAVNGVCDVRFMCKDIDGKVILEYSPEHFNETEIDYALQVCEEVAENWLPYGCGGLIINLPATVERDTPNIFADQVEYFSRHLSCRKDITLSVHVHNDRGCAVAATELAIMAGADRVEGTLFGNGERTGNTNIITMAGNMMSKGIDPKVSLEKLPEIAKKYETLTNMNIDPRLPYVGSLVYTAFSGSHQDAISKGTRAGASSKHWDVPYLPVDPADCGRTYESVVRINSQSGKGGLDYILQSNFGLKLPKNMLVDFSREIQALSEKLGEILPEQILNSFEKKYCLNQKKITFISCVDNADVRTIRLLIEGKGIELEYGTVLTLDELFPQLIYELTGRKYNYQMSVSSFFGGCGRSFCCVELCKEDNEKVYGASIGAAAVENQLMALISAINNLPYDFNLG